MTLDIFGWVIIGCIIALTVKRTAWRHARDDLYLNHGLWFR